MKHRILDTGAKKKKKNLPVEARRIRPKSIGRNQIGWKMLGQSLH